MWLRRIIACSFWLLLLLIIGSSLATQPQSSSFHSQENDRDSSIDPLQAAMVNPNRSRGLLAAEPPESPSTLEEPGPASGDHSHSLLQREEDPECTIPTSAQCPEILYTTASNVTYADESILAILEQIQPADESLCKQRIMDYLCWYYLVPCEGFQTVCRIYYNHILATCTEIEEDLIRVNIPYNELSQDCNCFPNGTTCPTEPPPTEPPPTEAPPACTDLCQNEGECVGEICSCPPIWTGPYCEIPICSPSCYYGTCNNTNQCDCDPGWTGPRCMEPFCEKGCEHGNCTDVNVCTCEFGWMGPNCGLRECENTDFELSLTDCDNGLRMVTFRQVNTDCFDTMALASKNFTQPCGCGSQAPGSEQLMFEDCTTVSFNPNSTGCHDFSGLENTYGNLPCPAETVKNFISDLSSTQYVLPGGCAMEPCLFNTRPENIKEPDWDKYTYQPCWQSNACNGTWAIQGPEIRLVSATPSSLTFFELPLVVEPGISDAYMMFSCLMEIEEHFDTLTFSLNGTVLFPPQSGKSWRGFKVFLPEGLSIARWEYRKDSSTDIDNLLIDYLYLHYAQFDGVVGNPTDPCLSSPCLNGGRCLSSGGEYQCVCVGDYSGDHCEISPVNICDSSPCKNNGQCIPSQNNDAFTCVCTGDFVGELCTVPVPTVKPTGSTRPTNPPTSPPSPTTPADLTIKILGGMIGGGLLVAILIGCIVVVRSRSKKLNFTGRNSRRRPSENEYELELLDSDDFDSDNMEEVDLFDADVVPQQRHGERLLLEADEDSDLDLEVQSLQRLRD